MFTRKRVSPAKGERPLDPGRLFPVIVPTGYFPSAPPARVPFLEGLDIAFGEGGDGVVGYMPDARLEALGLTTRDAERIALENLSKHVRRGDVDGRAKADHPAPDPVA